MGNNSRNSDASLARLLDLDDAGFDSVEIQPDLSTMWSHQLAAPLSSDLKLPDSQKAEAQQYKTFGGLIQHAQPPVWLLEEVKQLAKQNRQHADNAVRQISTVLYYAAIAAAVLRCQKRISDLSDAQLREGLEWAQQQSWIDPVTRELFDQATFSIARKPA